MKNDKVSKESKDLVIENVEQIKKMFPEVVSEGKINLEKLKSILGQELDSKGDSYTFNWAGRKDAFRSIQATAKGTLVPNEKESINFKQTKNIFIEGDNLEVLKLLQKSYFNQIKMIYIDPPYNTGHDFVYKDNFKNGIKAYLEQTGQLNGDGVLLTTNPETSGRFHSDWISMMYPRLFLARNLLNEEGVIFVSINDTEVHNLRRILDEIFGEENFISQLVWENKEGGGGSDSKFFRLKHEYIICYAKNIESLNIRGIEISNEDRYNLSDKHEKTRGKYYLQKLDMGTIQYSKSLDYPITTPDGKEVNPEANGKRACWRWSKDKVKWGIENDFIEFKKGRSGEWQVYTKQYLNVDNEGKPIERKNRPLGVISNYSTIQASKYLDNLFGARVFDYSKPKELIEYLIRLTDEDKTESNIILDFFAGSGTTADAVLEQNVQDSHKRKFILVQLPEKTDEESEAYKHNYKTIADIAKERIRRVIKKLEKEEKAKLTKENIDLGFKVFKLEKSNYKIWENYEGQDIKELTKQLDLFKSPLVNGYDNYNVIYECIVKEGLNLNAEIEKRDINGNTIYKVSDGNQSFHICLDEKIKQENLNKLDLRKDDVFICLDSSLDDSKKVNISLQCKLKTL